MKQIIYRIIKKKEWRHSDEYNNRKDQLSEIEEIIDCKQFKKMDKKDVIIEIIRNHYAYTCQCDIKETDRIAEDLGLDSLDKIEIAAEIEKKFNIKIVDDKAISVNTVKDFIELVP